MGRPRRFIVRPTRQESLVTGHAGSSLGTGNPGHNRKSRLWGIMGRSA